MNTDKQTGFTLIELMITVAIVAILASIAYPSYQDQVRKSRRSDGISKMLDVAQRQERYYTQHQKYTSDASGNLNYGVNPIPSDEGYYTVSTTAGNCPSGAAGCTFTVTATAVGSQLKDTNCRSFTINDRGVRSAKNSGGTDSTTTCY